MGGAGTGSSQSTQLRGVSVAEATEWVATLQAASTDTTSADALTPGRVVVDAHLGDSSPIIILGSPVTPTDVLPVGGSLHTPPAPLTPSTAQQLQHQRQPSGEADAWNRAAAAGAPDSGAGVGVTSGSGDVPTLQDSSVLQLPPTPVTSAATPQEEAVLPAVTPAPAVGSQSPLPRAVSPQPASRSSSALPDGYIFIYSHAVCCIDICVCMKFCICASVGSAGCQSVCCTACLYVAGVPSRVSGQLRREPHCRAHEYAAVFRCCCCCCCSLCKVLLCYWCTVCLL